MAPLSDKHRLVIRLAVTVALLAVLPAWIYIEPRTLSVERSVVSSPQVPAGFEGARIVFLSDIHAGSWLGSGQVDRALKRVRSLEPDIVILGGDNVAGGAGGDAIVYPRLKHVTAKLAKVAVLGNHDDDNGTLTALDGLAAAGFRVLESESIRVGKDGDWIRIAGVQDVGVVVADVGKAASDISPGEFAILVAHNPDTFAEGLPATVGAFDLALAGHTHGGQATLFGLWSPFMGAPSHYGQRYRGGWLEEAGVPILVTRGVGVGVWPGRFMAPPQIHLITLHKGPASVRH